MPSASTSQLTCTSVLSQGQGEKLHCTTRFISYQKQNLNITTTEQSKTYQRSDSEASGSSLFECVKTPKKGHYRRESSSLSLFQSCRRPSECENEYSSQYPFNRSDSARSSGSQSFTFNHHQSRTSLASNTSCNSKLSFPDYTEEELAMLDGEEPTFESDLRRVRDYHVVTTAGELKACYQIKCMYIAL